MSREPRILPSEPARFLITGGAGFVGSHLVDALLARGDRVVVLDDLSSGSRANLAAALAQPGFALHIGSADDAPLVHTLVANCDVVLHLAAAAGVRRILRRTHASLATNLAVTQTVLTAAAAALKPVLLASSSEVYGKGASLPFAEDQDLLLGPTTSPRWSYGGAKAVGEWLAFALAREAGLRVLCVRLFNTVGPRQRAADGMVLPTFVAQALRGAPLTVHGHGAQTRCFAHVRDVVDALVRLVDTPPAWGQVVNVGSDREVRIADLAELVRTSAGSDAPIVQVEALADQPQRRVPDLRKLKALIGAVPATPLEQIVRDVIAASDGASVLRRVGAGIARDAEA